MRSKVPLVFISLFVNSVLALLAGDNLSSLVGIQMGIKLSSGKVFVKNFGSPCQKCKSGKNVIKGTT
jgi:hypothetical protein